MPKKKGVPDIITFICDPAYLGPDTQISAAQRAVLKAAYGLEMTPEELDAFREITDGERPRKGGYNDIWCIIGQRSGKTDKILANVAVFEGFVFNPLKWGSGRLNVGEEAFYPLVAQNVYGANRARSYIEGKLLRLEDRGWQILDHGEAQQRAITGKEIRCRKHAGSQSWSLIYRCFPCSKAAVRGITAIGCGTDESAWWRTEEGAYNADIEVFRALRGRGATFGKRYKKWNVTSPYGEEGMAWDKYLERHHTRSLVVNCPSWQFNPNLDAAFLEEERTDDPVAYLRDYGAQFGKEGGGFLSPAEIGPVMDAGRPEIIPAEGGHAYVAAIDAAFKHDLYTLAIGHLEDGVVVFDVIEARQGTKKVPLVGEVIAEEYSGLMKPYGIDTVIGDQHFDLAIEKDYETFGIKVVIQAQTDKSNYEAYKNLKALIRRRLINLPDKPIIRKDLLSLRLMKGGTTPKIQAPNRSGFHDDISKGCSVVVMKLYPAARLDLKELNDAAIPNQREPEDLDGMEMDDWSHDIRGTTL